MKIGAHYYPEQWPVEQWTGDFDNMAAMGLQLVHLGEFAWHDLEPSPHDFRLDWLSDCVDLAAGRGMEVILCTPTAAPPIWFTDRYPQALPVDEFGRRARFGGRRHYTPTSNELHEAAWRIVTALGERFGHHPAIIGWQIDNELSSEFFDQSPQTHRAFRKWLMVKYGAIDALNAAWGCAFWNTYYQDFDQILMPAGRDPGYRNPHQCLDASRFWSWAFADFAKLQIDALRFKIDTQRQFITTNFMPFHLDVSPGDLANDLTLFTWDSYPLDGTQTTGQQFRIGDPAAIGLMHDQMASYTGRFAVMELQPGQTNWTGVPVLPHPGAMRLWLWTAFAHGAEFVTTYRYRQPRSGIELFHAGLLGPDGQTLSPGGIEFAQTIEEMAQLHAHVNEPPAHVNEPLAHVNEPLAHVNEPDDETPCVGLVFDFEQFWYFSTLPQARRWDLPALLRIWYAAVARMGWRIRILQPGRAWPENLPLIIAPGLQMLDPALIGQLVTALSHGTHLLLNGRTGWLDRQGQRVDGPLAEPILPLIGARIASYDALPTGMEGQIQLGESRYPWSVWAEQLIADEGTAVLARYADQPYAGAAAITQTSPASGGVTYCGVYAAQALADALIEKLARDLSNNRRPLPERVHLIQRGGLHILLNYSDLPVEGPAPETATFVIGSRNVPACDIAVWKET